MKPTEQVDLSWLTTDADTSGPSAMPATAEELVSIAENSRQPFEPELALFVDESLDSKQAQEVLRTGGQRFRILQASGPAIPALVFGGIVAERLTGVERAVRALAAFDAALTRGLPKVVAHRRG